MFPLVILSIEDYNAMLSKANYLDKYNTAIICYPNVMDEQKVNDQIRQMVVELKDLYHLQ